MLGDVHTRIRNFFSTVGARLDLGLGQREEQLKPPVEQLVRAKADDLGLSIGIAGEVPLGNIRPDFAVAVPDGAAITGLIELKAPGAGVDTRKFTGHNAKQWTQLAQLPNVLYTDGLSWALYRDGQLAGSILTFDESALHQVETVDAKNAEHLDLLLADFLMWEPRLLRTPASLATTAARLCRVLRNVTLETLESSDTSTESGLEVLARDWRELLFPDASAEAFADSFAQTVTFGLLLARAQGIEFADRRLREIATDLSKSYSLIGRALEVVGTSSLESDVALSTMKRVLGAVDWSILGEVEEERAWLYFYEDFLEAYDPKLRRRSGSYYTPEPVVATMTRLTEQVLNARLDLDHGFSDEAVRVLDPAMGTGTFLLDIVARCQKFVSQYYGEGAVPQELQDLAKRLIGFERMTGPYAVAHLRLHAALRNAGAELSDDLVRVFVADTLADPYIEQTQLGGFYEPIARSRRAANSVKRDERVMVVVGNPPYRDKARGHGGWVESGSSAALSRPIFADFVPPPEWGQGAHVRHLYNMNVFFWRWAIWKAFEAHEDNDRGVVAFITTAAFLDGPGFQQMRSHLRSVADEIWVIDLTPEGHRPDVPTRIFPTVQQTIAITIAGRFGGGEEDRPARVNFRSVTPGRRDDKFVELGVIDLDDGSWLEGSRDWRASFRPGDSGWQPLPSLEDLLPWTGTGIMTGRNWVTAPDPEVLSRRWRKLVSTRANSAERSRLYVEHKRDRPLDKSISDGLPGFDPRSTPIGSETGPLNEPVRIGFRSFDYQWIIPDKRLLNVPNTSLWQVRSATQVFLTFSHDRPLVSGPGVVLSTEIPDAHYFHGRGGKVAPFWRDTDCQDPNLPPELASYLAAQLDCKLESDDVFAYLVGVVGHSGYSRRFRSELARPGPRVPVSLNLGLFKEAVHLGHMLIRIQTTDEPSRWGVTVPRCKVVEPIPLGVERHPADIAWSDGVMSVGDGAIGPVSQAAWSYSVNGMNVFRNWFRSRSSEPGGRRGSPLDDLGVEGWTATLTRELLMLATRLNAVVSLEHQQAVVLDRIIEGQLATHADLVEAGVLPVPAEYSRKPPLLGPKGGLFP